MPRSIHYSYYLWYIYYIARHPVIHWKGEKGLKKIVLVLREVTTGMSTGGRSNPEHRDSEKSTKYKVLHEILANFLCQLMSSSKVYYLHKKYIYNKIKKIIVVIIYWVYYLQGTILNALYALLHLTLTITWWGKYYVLSPFHSWGSWSLGRINP